MGRRAHITDADLVNAAARTCARLGLSRATIEAIAKEAGVPVGSVYHRVASRAALLAEVWIAAAQVFGGEFLRALEAAGTSARTTRRRLPSSPTAVTISSTARPMTRAPAQQNSPPTCNMA